MGDTPPTHHPNPKPSQDEIKILIEPIYAPREPPPPYYQTQPQPQIIIIQHDPSYGQRQTPGYSQRVGGQNVYYSGGYPTEPPNVSRGQSAYQANYPGRNNDDNFQRNSEIFGDVFDSVAIRNNFVRKVYTILSTQLFFSFAFILLVTFVWELRMAIVKNFLPIMIVSMLFYFCIYIALVCCIDLRRNFPVNFILLGLLTLALTLLMCCFVAVSSPIVVLAAVGTTAAVCLLVSLFACQTSYDITGCGMCLCIAMLVLMLYGFVIMILTLVGIYLPILHVVYSALAVVLFCMYLMYDTQMLMGGRRIELSPEEYIFGALSLYVDIMYIFMHLLTLYQYCLGQ